MKFTMYYVCVYRNGEFREKHCVKSTDSQLGTSRVFDLIDKLSQRFGWDDVEYRVTRNPDVYAEAFKARKDDEMAKDRNIKKGNKKPKQKSLKDRKREKREKKEKESKQI